MTPIDANGEVIEELKAEIKRLAEALQTAHEAMQRVLTLPRPHGDYGSSTWEQWDAVQTQIEEALRTAGEEQ